MLTMTMFCSFGKVLARRVPSQIACDDSNAAQGLAEFF